MSQHESGFGAPVEPMGESFEMDVPPAGWPTVIGVMSIIFAAIGLLYYGCGSLGIVLNPLVMGMIPEDQRPPAVSTGQLVAQGVQACGAFLLSCWLLLGGIGLCKRRPSAARTCMGWAYAKIVFSLIGGALGLLFLDASVQQVNAQFPNFQVTRQHLVIITAVMILLVMFWPAFLLLWFARGSAKDEVARWSDPAFGVDDDFGA